MNLIALLLFAAATAVAVLVFGLGLSLIYYGIAGLVIGALGRLALPGRENIGIIGTALVGLAGGAAGGVVGRALGVGQLFQLALAVAAAALLLTLLGVRSR